MLGDNKSRPVWEHEATNMHFDRLVDAVNKAIDAATLGVGYDSRMRTVLELSKPCHHSVGRAVVNTIEPLYEIVASSHWHPDIFAALSSVAVARLTEMRKYLATCKKEGIHEYD